MASKSHNGNFDEQPRQPSAGGAPLSSPEEITALAQTYFATDFPNSERLGCPTTATLRSLVRADELPDDLLRAHMFGCSECFQEYRAALEARRSAAPLPNVSWLSRLKATLTGQRTPVFAGALSLVLLCFIGAYVWQKLRAVPAPIVAHNDAASANTSQDASSTDARASVTPGSVTEAERQTEQPAHVAPTNQKPVSPQRPRPTDQPPRDLIAMNTVKVDLEDYTALRGGADTGGGQAQTIKLSRTRTRLLLTLPEGSLEGLYDVSIVDASGNSLATAKARSADGQTIAATLDLQKLPVQKYRLRISREGEAPGYYPIILETQKPLHR